MNFIWEIQKLISFLYALGFFSEIILVIIVSLLIHSQFTNFIIYLVAFAINGFIVNQFLKNWIKELRPKNPIKFLDSENFKNKKAYGMPSGHSQNVFFSITYLVLTLYDNINIYLPWIFVSVLIGILTLWERWIFHNHTLFQLFVGAILGSILAFLVVFLRDSILEKYRNIQK